MEAKLYSPVFNTYWSGMDIGHNDPDELTQQGMVECLPEIRAAILDKCPQDAERGYMAYYGTVDSINEKVKSLFVDVEIHNERLWAVATVNTTAPLTTDEFDSLKEYITDDVYADELGGELEHDYINIDGGEIVVSLWKHGDEFFIDSQAEFALRLGIDNLAPSPAEPPLTPAQAALYEPDASDSAEVAALRERLINKLDADMTKYLADLNKTAFFSVDKSAEVAATFNAYNYLTELHNFHPSEINYLLQFKESLKVAAEEFEWDAATDNRSNITWKIFHDQEALKSGRYELVQGDTVNDTYVPENYVDASEPPVTLPDPTGKGYVFALTDDSEFYIPNALHVERDDSMMTFKWDEDAADAAERDGIPLIIGMDGVPDDVYIDTPENREIITLHLTAEARQRLVERAQQNWDDYRNKPHNTTPDNLFNMSVKVIGHRNACQFIKDYDGFTAEQLNCLLQFAVPVDLIADYLDPQSDISEMPGILANILEEQETFKQHYALVSESDTSSIEGMVQQLRDRLKENYDVYKRDMIDLSKEGIFYAAAEIMPVIEAYGYFSQEHNYKESEVNFLLKFENPLEYVSDRWSAAPVAHARTIEGIFADQERTLQKGGYSLIPDKPETALTVPDKPTHPAAANGEKPSVIERIKQHAEEQRRRTAEPKNPTNRKKTEQEL